MICPGPIRLCPAQNDQKGVRATTAKSWENQTYTRRVNDLFAPPLISGEFVRVAVERAVDRYPAGLLYSIPQTCEDIQAGHRVLVPLGRGNSAVPGTVVERVELKAAVADGLDPDRIKPIIERTDDLPPLPAELLDLATWISSYYACPIGITLANIVPSAVRKGIGSSKRLLITPAAVIPDPLPRLGKKQQAVYDAIRATAAADLPIASNDLAAQTGVGGTSVLKRLAELGLLELESVTTVEARARAGSGIEDRPVELNESQATAVESIGRTLGGGFSSHLLFGVTGSGKTEVYLRLTRQALDAGRTVLILVPEIALTPQTTARVLARFPGSPAAVLHSGLTAAQRHRDWRRVADGKANIVLGARSAIFAPIPDDQLGLVIVDEEHDPSYKQDQAPRYQGRDVAIRRAQLAGCPVVLGSATPALESWHNATRTGRSALHRLPDRAPGLTLPKVQIVDFSEERRNLDRTGIRLIGPRLSTAIKRTLEGGGQVMLLLNRRGYANYIACPDHRCGWVMTCTECDAGMVCHQNTRSSIRDRWVRCHHCDAQLRLPPTCPLCRKKTTVFGLGTQRVEEDLSRLHPDLARSGAMVRVDSDSMNTGDDFHDVLGRFRTGEIRLLAGTQMIAKGLDFPGVRLVGVVNADTALNMPDFRASERTFQLVAQVVGRCGRSSSAGEAIIQTFQPDAPAIRRAAEHDYEGFAEQELADRERFQLPPNRRLTRIVIRDGGETEAARLATMLADRLRSLESQEGIEIRGPLPCSIARIAARYRMQLEIFAERAGVGSRFIANARANGIFTGPLALGEAVAIDVDPTSLM